MSDAPTATQDQQPEDEGLRSLREAAEAGKRAQRELAFVRAGIDPATGPAKLLFENYKGDPTTDAVLAAAAEYGITPPAPEQAAPPPEQREPEVPKPDDDERQHFATRGEQTGGAGAEEAELANGDPWPEAFRQRQATMAEGAPTSEANAAALGAVFEAAQKGNRHVVYDRDAWYRANGGE